jgi:hypothetical protein
MCYAEIAHDLAGAGPTACQGMQGVAEENAGGVGAVGGRVPTPVAEPAAAPGWWRAVMSRGRRRLEFEGKGSGVEQR